MIIIEVNFTASELKLTIKNISSLFIRVHYSHFRQTDKKIPWIKRVYNMMHNAS